MMAVLMSRVESTRPPGVRSTMTRRSALRGVSLGDRAADVRGRDRMDDAVDFRGVDDRRWPCPERGPLRPWRGARDAAPMERRGRAAGRARNRLWRRAWECSCPIAGQIQVLSALGAEPDPSRTCSKVLPKAESREPKALTPRHLISDSNRLATADDGSSTSARCSFRAGVGGVAESSGTPRPDTHGPARDPRSRSRS